MEREMNIPSHSSIGLVPVGNSQRQSGPSIASVSHGLSTPRAHIDVANGLTATPYPQPGQAMLGSPVLMDTGTSTGHYTRREGAAIESGRPSKKIRHS